MAVARKIVGPQDHFERSGVQSLRDIRPFTTRLSEDLRSSASGIVLAVAAGATFFEPAVLDLTVPLSMLYAAWVLTRPVKLPLRKPRSAGGRDIGNPMPGTRQAKIANGSKFLGWSIGGHELWITPEDERQHMTVPGTTGAGKTATFLSLLTNALARGSGFVLVDGKGDRDLFGKVMGLARRFGREDDVRVLNLMVASGTRDSHSFNPFTIGNADAIRELLASQLGDQAPNDANGVFRERAVALIGTIAPVLVWLRDVKGLPLNIDVIRFSIELRWIWKLAKEKIVLVRDPATGSLQNLDVRGEIPEDIVWPLLSYLGELPGFDPDLPLDRQKGDEPSKQHGFAQFYFTAMFTQLAVSLGHIFRVESGDIDMRDVVLNRRILVVILPALENSDATLAALGKLVVAALRGMMAQLLGASLEGEYTEKDKPGMGPSPFPIVLDELAYYATSGLDRMLAMGRGLNISFMLGFQEIAGLWARLGDKTASLLGNANLTIAMRQAEAGRTREWLENAAGKTFVTQASSYIGGNDGSYREAKQAEVRPISRVDWNDLTSLIEGEAIILFGGRRIYATLFHAQIDDSGTKRVGRTLMLREPQPKQLLSRFALIDEMVSRIEHGSLKNWGLYGKSPALTALAKGFKEAAGEGKTPQEAASAALQALAGLELADLPPRPTAPSDGTPVTAVFAMMEQAGAQPIPARPAKGYPQEPIDKTIARGLLAIEFAHSRDDADAMAAAALSMTERDAAMASVIEIEPPAITEEKFVAALTRLLAHLRSFNQKALSEAAE
jgi:intracellular multiplication protein IcmO